jgi:hypothetical protein
MKVFERSIIGELLSAVGNKCLVFPDQAHESTIEFTGGGYFLTLRDPSFPKNRVVLDKPDIRGKIDGIDVGYLAFVENHEFPLECYSYGHEISAVNREQGFDRVQT